MSLEKIRERIEKIDHRMVRLLEKRMELAVLSKRFKPEVFDESRERVVLENVSANSKHLVRPDFSKNLFSQIMEESKKLQEHGFILVGFQGEHGAYSEIASKKIGNAVTIPFVGFNDVFDAVKNEVIDFGVVPVENSIEGPLSQVNDLLIETDLKIVGEINVQIDHCLVCLPGTDHREIKTVFSHPQALGQCREFIKRNKLQARLFYDTAGAAKMVSIKKPGASAAIASKLAAQLYNLEILKEGIQDNKDNFTRFVVLSKEPRKENGTKCSIAFSTEHKAGSLLRVLKIFGEAGINLSRIESRPIRGKEKAFGFLLDFEGNEGDPKIVLALEKVKQETAKFNFLGCYRGL